MDNVYKIARKRAAKINPELNNAKSAQDIVLIERSRLLKIESDTADPRPDEVIIMTREYNAPELINHYCTHQCPLGVGSETLIYDNLDRISVTLMASLHALESAQSSLYRILEDGKVSANEEREFNRILNTLSKIAYSAESLKLWAKCNGIPAENK